MSIVASTRMQRFPSLPVGTVTALEFESTQCASANGTDPSQLPANRLRLIGLQRAATRGNARLGEG